MSSFIPEEIILNILSRLQVKSLLRFRCVCKSWSKLLSSNNLDFVRMHLDHALDEKNNNCSLIINRRDKFYSIDSVSSTSSELCYDAVKFDIPFKSRLLVNISGSCNGLLCVATDSHGSNFFIWNPSTKEYREISTPSKQILSNCAYGFGYDSKIDDYKLVRILSFPPGDDVKVEVNVYTLGSSSWRNVQSVPPNSFETKESVGVLVNGSLHWINLTEVIVSFDICDERFQEIELPNCLVDIWFTTSLVVLRGDLCVLADMHDSRDLWVMKEYGVNESWTKLFSIAQETDILYKKPVHTFKNGEILFWVQLYMDDTDTLVSYDPKLERARTLKIQGIPEWFENIEAYVGSLVSPNQVL